MKVIALILMMIFFILIYAFIWCLAFMIINKL